MKVSKASREFATRVYRMCLENGELDESKLSKSIKFLGEKRPSDYLGVLTELKRLVRIDVDKRTAHVESAQKITAADQTRIEKSLTAKHGKNLVFNYSTNKDLIAGLKVRVGSSVYDGTVLSKINRLANSL